MFSPKILSCKKQLAVIALIKIIVCLLGPSGERTTESRVHRESETTVNEIQWGESLWCIGLGLLSSMSLKMNQLMKFSEVSNYGV